MPERETCEQCGFDSDLYNRPDAISSQRIMPAVLAAAVEGLDEKALATRPEPQTWSIIEYLDHVREVASGNRLAIELAVATPGADLGAPPEPVVEAEPKQLELAATLVALTTEFSELQSVLQGLDPVQWDDDCTVDGDARSVGWFARHVLHDSLHHLADIGRIRSTLGLGAPRASGTVTGLHVSDGGVPKNSVGSVVVSPAGVAGDAQSDRRHHGRPVQAVCLWSEDVIADLGAEGHPIHPGAAGENLTIGGVAWEELRPGSRIDVGSVRLLISAHAIPCGKNARWFSDGDFNRILHETNPGWSRLYAIPLNAGEITVGDAVVVEPAG